MADSANSSAAGGFLPPHIQSLPSPAPTTTSTTSTIIAGLPHPRTHALRPGSAKEDQLRNFVSDRMEHVSRRFLKKSGRASSPGPGGDDNLVGYTSMAELCKDLDEAINIIWLSGTRRSSLHTRTHRTANSADNPPQQTSKSPSSSTSPASSTPG